VFWCHFDTEWLGTSCYRFSRAPKQRDAYTYSIVLAACWPAPFHISLSIQTSMSGCWLLILLKPDACWLSSQTLCVDTKLLVWQNVLITNTCSSTLKTIQRSALLISLPVPHTPASSGANFHFPHFSFHCGAGFNP
jgi:hypothetical protein